MAWLFRWGDSLKTGFYHKLLSDGKIKQEDQEPDLPEFCIFYLDAFQELGTCRINGLDLGPIPFTAIVEYSKIWKVEDFEDFHYIIRRMDRKYMELTAKKSSEKSKAQGKGNGEHPAKQNRSDIRKNGRPSRG